MWPHSLRFALALALPLVACTAPADSPSPHVDPDPPTSDIEVQLVLSASATSTLAAVAEVTTEEDARVALEFWNDDVGRLRSPSTALGRAHALDLLGMRGDSTYAVQAVATLPDGSVAHSAAQDFETGPAPGGIPGIEVEFGDGAPGGITLISPATNPPNGTPYEGPYSFGVDREGEVVWYLDSEQLAPSSRPSRPLELLDDGNLEYLVANNIQVFSPAGELVREIRSGSPPSWRIHHDVAAMDDGGFVVLDNEVNEVDVAFFGGPTQVNGDLLRHLDADGEILWTWSTFDHLDLQRWPGEWSQTSIEHGDGGVAEWTHGNSVAWHEPTGSLVVSLRHQNQVIAVERASGELQWLFGEDGDFELLSGSWFNTQHAATMPSEDEIMLFDNDNEGDEDSRAVLYRIDWAQGTAEQTWEHRLGLFSDSRGSARRLPSGHVLISAGGSREPDQPARVVEVDGDEQAVWTLDLLGDHQLADATRVDWAMPID